MVFVNNIHVLITRFKGEDKQLKELNQSDKDHSLRIKAYMKTRGI